MKCVCDPLQQDLQFVDENDGTFWMDFEDFKHYFNRLYLCKTVAGYVFSHVPVQQRPESFTLLRAHVPLDGHYTFSGSDCLYVSIRRKLCIGNNRVFVVSQKSHRCFPKGHGYKHVKVALRFCALRSLMQFCRYGSSRMIVAKLNGRSLSDGLTYIKGGKGAG